MISFGNEATTKHNLKSSAALNDFIIKKKLLTLQGIGEYSAELVMPKTGFPLDVWSAKIFHVLFYGKIPEKPRDAIPALKSGCGTTMGQLERLRVCLRLKRLAQVSKRLGIDLTKF